MPSPRSLPARFLVLGAAALVLILGSTLLGPTVPTWGELFPIDFQAPFWHLRVPRTCLAALAGAGLAVSGVIFQALFRNPLAEPYTLGVASGASLAAAIGFFAGLSGYVGWFPVRLILALAGAIAAMSLVYLMARLRGGQDMTRLLLAGVCVSYTSSAGILLVSFLADRTVTNEIIVWLMGSLGVYRPAANIEIAVVLALLLAFAVYSHRAIDLLWLGPDLAAARGVHVGRTIWGCFTLVSLLTAVIVANCGPIGFVGLMVPHIARALFGVRTLPLLGAAALGGAAFLATCDGLGRVALSVVHQRPVGFEFPVGVLTNIIGAAFFFYLLATRDTTPGTSR
ncbi:MAG: iron ABC transporter permease [Phycisphaerae bacterium]|jgi:iron complex transport system permease protein